jgi:hypothetical protein
MKKTVLMLILLCYLPFFGQNKNTSKDTKIDTLLEGLSVFVTMTDQDIIKSNTEYNFKIDLDKKFIEIDSLLATGMTSHYDIALIPLFKKAFDAYRHIDKQKAIVEFKILINKGFAPATIAYITTLGDKNEKEREKYIEIGYLLCSEYCRALKMELLYSKKGSNKNIPFPKKCYIN